MSWSPRVTCSGVYFLAGTTRSGGVAAVIAQGSAQGSGRGLLAAVAAARR